MRNFLRGATGSDNGRKLWSQRRLKTLPKMMLATGWGFVKVGRLENLSGDVGLWGETWKSETNREFSDFTEWEGGHEVGPPIL